MLIVKSAQRLPRLIPLGYRNISMVPSNPSNDSSFSHRPSPIPAPPQAHHPISPLYQRPKLLSQLTRSTLPSSSLTYAQMEENKRYHYQQSHFNLLQNGESSSSASWRLPTVATNDEPFPDLDPTTGLPLEISRHTEEDTDVASLHLQRTITDLMKTPPKQKTSFLPSLPSIPLTWPKATEKGVERKRSMSTSSKQDDWFGWTPGWWSGHKKDVDKDLAEEDQAETVEEEQEKLRRKYKTPKYPLVFCHGLLGFDYIGPASLPPLQISHWRGIREVLEANGCDVLITRVPATSSIKDRAAILEEAISERYPHQKINLIGHSMGGLDCRFLVSEFPNKRFTPVSLTTISTPHRGSPFADYVIDNVIGRERLTSLLSLMETFRLPQSGDGTAFEALGTRSMQEFNALILDRPDVKYYSWGASFEPGLLDTFRWPHSVVLAKEGPNDGLVSVQSAQWGEYRGTLLGVNHLDLVGWVNHVRYALSGWTGKPITFKPATFYLEVADYLAEQGF
ncbi:hypothetical protein TREMEDRAFT_68852 [Tremella mesenterica DSM 1558]|uniref:uncharacterized protein n=1 Tax=Tremella mesenterica (strain ATCC 24925 / CBS 8224 / DSM 1558 / NBRC 9311 / NRRL Y-6157 / RJB 2259-6 / UBC 559-6) TaxID=578456 RepID=UPI0003F4A3FC|nr:uncharacterized protein TREMEDRAFT_68852 [Tremella mesenterica DSM 1558]EIW68895.1 hypothetical protein TREMEDRAFT_68852 [Tremella mesenterica DSM 1558]